MLRYSTVADIEAARDRALRDLQIRLSILKGNRRSLKQKVENYQAQAADLERRGMQVDVARLRTIEDLQSEIANPTINRLTFFDGINIDAFEDSTISARIMANTFTDNFERALSLNTYQRATINALVANNAFVGNDRGAATGVQTPVTAVGQERMNLQPQFFVGDADVEVVNNEEYLIRFFEKPVFTVIGGDDDGELFDPVTGMVIEGDGAPGVAIPGNTGFDILGNPVPVGTADINVAFLDNGFQHGVDALDFAINDPGRLALGGEGTNSDLQGLGTIDTTVSLVDQLITNEELSFIMAGFDR
jgi:hypothetical protein